MGHRKYAALQEAAKQCEKTNSVRRSGRSIKRSQAVTDAIDDELQSCERAKAGQTAPAHGLVLWKVMYSKKKPKR